MTREKIKIIYLLLGKKVVLHNPSYPLKSFLQFNVKKIIYATVVDPVEKSPG